MEPIVIVSIICAVLSLLAIGLGIGWYRCSKRSNPDCPMCAASLSTPTNNLTPISLTPPLSAAVQKQVCNKPYSFSTRDFVEGMEYTTGSMFTRTIVLPKKCTEAYVSFNLVPKVLRSAVNNLESIGCEPLDGDTYITIYVNQEYANAQRTSVIPGRELNTSYNPVDRSVLTSSYYQSLGGNLVGYGQYSNTYYQMGSPIIDGGIFTLQSAWLVIDGEQTHLKLKFFSTPSPLSYTPQRTFEPGSIVVFTN